MFRPCVVKRSNHVQEKYKIKYPITYKGKHEKTVKNYSQSGKGNFNT